MRCSHCQQVSREGARFCAALCDHCGTPLAGSVPIATSSLVEPRPQRPQTCAPSHLAEKILTSKAALEGERKQVTILFADLKGSMEPLVDRDSEEVHQWLDPVLEGMMAAVELRDKDATRAEEEVRARLRALVQAYPRMDRAFVTDLHGVLRSDYPRAPESLAETFPTASGIVACPERGNPTSLKCTNGTLHPNPWRRRSQRPFAMQSRCSARSYTSIASMVSPKE